MPASPEALLSLLHQLGVEHTNHAHPPIFTVAEGEHLKASLPGGHSKNLFLKDKRGALFLVCALGETKIDLVALSKALSSGRLSFGSAALLGETLAVTPGSVTVFALLNDERRAVSLVLDAALLAADPLNFHPLTNTATTAISRAGLDQFLAHTGHRPRIFSFSAAGLPSPIVPQRQEGHVGDNDD